MNKSEIVGRVAWRMGLSKARAEHAVDTVLAAIGEALAKDDEVRIAGFGRFATRSRAARTGERRWGCEGRRRGGRGEDRMGGDAGIGVGAGARHRGGRSGGD